MLAIEGDGMKSKSLLINYSGYPTSINALMPDNGLAVLAGSLLSHGHETTIIDYNTIDILLLRPPEYGERLFKLNQDRHAGSLNEFKEIEASLEQIQVEDIEKKASEIAQMVFDEEIDFLAFKLWTGKSFENSIKLAEAIKKIVPSILIFAGGPHVDYFRGKIYEVTNVFDVLAYGEGEETIVELADYVLGMREVESISNLVLQTDLGVIETSVKRLENLNESFPAYDIETYPAMAGDKKLKLFISEFSRGCPFQCNFCGHSNKSGSTWRSKSAERVVEEFNYVINMYGTRIFRNGDSNTPPHLIVEVAKKIIEEKVDIDYALISHVNNLRDGAFNLLKESGCSSVFFGVESGNQHIVDHSINKGLKLSKAREVISKSSESGLFVVASFVYPSPGETEQTKEDTFNFIKDNSIDAVSICVPIISPKSPWGDNPEKFGIELKEGYFDRLMSFTPALSFPPTMWKKPPEYSIDGKEFKEIAEESDRFVKSLEDEGVLTQVMDDAVLMANHSQMDYRVFRDSVRRYLTTGDYESLSDIVKKVNKSARNLPVKPSSTYAEMKVV